MTIDLANRLMPNQGIEKFKNNKNAIEDNDVAVMGGRIFEKVLEAIKKRVVAGFKFFNVSAICVPSTLETK